MTTNIDHERVRQRAAAVAEWRLQFKMTFEEAREHGAAWIRYLPTRVERIYLTGDDIRQLGYIPTGDKAYELVRMQQQYERLARDRADIQKRLKDD